MTRTKVLLCDDHHIFREGIKSIIEPQSGLDIIGEAVNGKECLRMIEELAPDIVLLDIRMPVLNGIECLKQIKERKLKQKVIALTQYDERRLIKQVLRYGADGYLLKDTSYEELVKACKHVMHHRTYYSPTVKAQMLAANGTARPDELFPDISQREKEVLWRICSEQSSKQIADHMCISIKTVENHRASIFKKIGVFNLAGLVKWAVLNHFDIP